MNDLKIGSDISLACQLLKSGQLVAIPTETVYGLAGNAFNLEAVANIFAVKNRPRFDPLILHTSSIHKIEEFAYFTSPDLQKLAENFWPGPITLLLDKKQVIDPLVTSGSEKVAVRIPAQKLTLALLDQLDFPLAAPSANPFGYISPTTAEHVQAQLGSKIPYILDGGECHVGLESTIIGYNNENKLTIFRHGGLPQEAIEAFLGKKIVAQTHSSSNPQAPGQLASHYAPRKKLYLANQMNVDFFSKKNIAFLGFDTIPDAWSFAKKKLLLSSKSCLSEAAQRLFSYMRLLDQDQSTEVIVAALVKNQGIGLAINDRLIRAAANPDFL